MIHLNPNPVNVRHLYNEVEINYFSGTGNSRCVAKWIEEEATTLGLRVRVQNITDCTAPDREYHADAPEHHDPLRKIVFFISPIHGFNYPPVMLGFIHRFKRGSSDVALMNTRGGLLIGKWITPGLTGIAFLYSALLLWLKGYKIRAMVPVDLPSNWIFLHPGLNKPTIAYMHEKNRERVKKHALEILSGKRLIKSKAEILIDLLIAPIALLYYFGGRFVLAKTFYASAKCDNCGLCISNCPVKAISNKNGRPFWTYRCESCMRCIGNCPVKAIQTAQGFFVFLVIAFSWLMGHIVYRITDRYVSGFSESIWSDPFEIALSVFFAALLYRGVHYLLRYRWFERLMVLTSLTGYKFWGRRYKAPANVK